MDVDTSVKAFIDKLSNELISEIFIHRILSFDRRSTSYNWLALTLGHVCSRWRDVAISTQYIWSRIFIPRKTGDVDAPSGVLSVVNLYLERSQAALLDIYIDRASISIVRPLMTHSHRWRTARWKCDERFYGTKNGPDGPLSALFGQIPCLEKLDISMINYSNHDHASLDYFESAPKLTSLGLYFITPTDNFDLDSFKFPWKNITSLTLNHLLPIQIMHFISLCPKLQNAEFVCDSSTEFEAQAYCQSFTSNSLTKISIISYDKATSSLCVNRWVLPSLEELSLTPASVQDITQMLEQSNCRTLHTLHIHCTGPWTSEQLFKLFANTPLLRKMTLHDETDSDMDSNNSDKTFDDWLLREMTYPEPDSSTTPNTDSAPAHYREQLLPRLERFIVYIPPESCTATGTVLANMIESRSCGSPSGVAAYKAGLATLQHITFDLRKLSGSMLDETSKEKVRKAQSHGMTVAIEELAC